MSSLLQSGIPVAQAFAIINGALTNSVLADDIFKLEQAVNGEGGHVLLGDTASTPRFSTAVRPFLTLILP